MTDRIFPVMPEGIETRLRAVRMAAEDDPSYFDDPKCPYSADLREILRKMLAESVELTRIPLFNQGVEPVDVVASELEAAIEEFKAIEKALGGADPADRVNYVKAKTQLLERWTSLKERLLSLKAMADFQNRIIGFMEEVLEKDQQQAFKKRVREHIGG